MTAEVVTMMMENIDISIPTLKLVKAEDELSCESQSDGLNLSDSEPKDSGIECDSSEQNSLSCDLPDQETLEKIMKTVEFYLSDENILKDPFLLKHVRRNKEGYVSLKLLASFRKVRSLSRNWKAVAHSVQKSTLLALNSDGTKVKRLIPLPEHDETVTSRSIIVSGFTFENPSSEISDMFAKFGDIHLVRILRPGGSIPSDVKKFIAKNPDLSSKICALVEFEEQAAAKKAMEDTQIDGITVLPVLVKKTKSESSPKKTASPPTTDTNGSPKESPKKKKKNRRSSNADKKSSLEGDQDSEQTRTRRSSSGSMSSQSSGYLSSSPNTITNPFESKHPRRHSYNPSSIFNDPKSSFASLTSRHLALSSSRDRLQGSSSRVDRLQQRRGTEGTVTSSPWRKRREEMMLSDSNLLASSASTGSLLLMKSHPVQTIRMPRGPDGTNGFCTRPRLPSTAE